MIQPKYVGILSCSGEEFPGGTVSRIATRLVLTRIRPEDTTTICVPLFLAGDNQEQDFVKNYPCITVDGCERRCAAKSVEMLNRTPMAEFILPDCLDPEDRDQVTNGPLHDLQWKDHPICGKLAEVIGDKVREINDQ